RDQQPAGIVALTTGQWVLVRHHWRISGPREVREPARMLRRLRKAGSRFAKPSLGGPAAALNRGKQDEPGLPGTERESKVPCPSQSRNQFPARRIRFRCLA